MAEITQYELKKALPNGAMSNYVALYKESTTTRFPPKPGKPLGKVNVHVPNPHVYRKDVRSRETMWTMVPGVWVQPDEANVARAARLPPGFDILMLDNIVSAKFNGKLRKGSAALGVTLGSWKQSREMIVKRLSDVSRVFERAYHRLKRNPDKVRELRHKRDPFANEFLEGEFGWRPLYEDVSKALEVMTLPLPPTWVTARHKAWVEDRQVLQQTYQRSQTDWLVRAQCTYGAKVAITNENLWLANMLGLVNPVMVIWDRIPWSWVVGMFGNFNQMISSMTDEVGLNVTDRHLTRSYKSVCSVSARFWAAQGVDKPYGFDADYLYTYKYRELGTSPLLRWQVRVPNVNWELAAIASAVVVQRISKLNRLITGI